MGDLRLYKKFKCYNVDEDGTLTNILKNPFSLTVNTINTSSNTIIENNPTLINESVGQYYISLNAIKYSFDQIYEVIWNVGYVSGAPSKILRTKFKLNPINISYRINTEIYSPTIEVELISNY